MEKMDKVSEMWKHCFFCGKAIDGKSNPEHVIPNRLLGRLGIKEQELSGNHTTQYSRIKVPAHSKCNSTFGSLYEDKIQNLLKDTDSLYAELLKEQDETPLIYNPSEGVTEIVTTWLSKIYYGLFYNDFLKTDSEKHRETCREIIESENFNLVRQSYKNGSGFTLPSSLYVFQTETPEFDLSTMIEPPTLLLKVNRLVLILCICDGHLTKNYLNSKNLETLKGLMKAEENLNRDFPAHKLALAEILALRLSIRKTPSFAFSNEFVMNMSFMTMVENPNDYYKIDEDEIDQNRNKILNNFGIQTKQKDITR